MHSVKNKVQTVSDHSHVKQKRLGQFFTGARLARLLAAVANAGRATSVIDPMCGTGDMLRAAAEFNPHLELTGIEIDGEVLKRAKMQLKSDSQVNLIQGSAFDYESLQRMRANDFDLVITNPPYVRYQSLSDRANEGDVPSASTIRHDLLKATGHLLTDAEDRRLFCELIRAYSGLSDLAVPSWVLAAMLTKVGGTLALVMPESWLSRDYAQIVQYILFRWFRIRYIVEDINASWFPNALVKTTLLVAERIHRRPSAFLWDNELYAHVRISAKAGNATSIVGNIFPEIAFPEKAFAEELESVLLKRESGHTPVWSVECTRLSETADNLQNTVGVELWFQKCEGLNGISINGVILPVELRRWLGEEGEKDVKSLEQLSVLVGQGLRTGANSFFYVDLIREDTPYVIVAPHRMFDIEAVRVHEQLLKPVLRKQSELPDAYQIKQSSLKGRVLLLHKHEITDELLKLIRTAETTKIRDKIIPELSAVRTNVRRTDHNNNTSSSWYTLPPLAPRHVPELLVPRVDASSPRTYMNDLGVVVDANFSTIWLNRDSAFTRWALLALLNSTWSVTCMELIGSVMGGGALKLEATHLKKIPLPNFRSDEISRLDTLGRALSQSGDPLILRKIDELVVGVFFAKDSVQDKLNQLKAIVRRRLDERSKRT